MNTISPVSSISIKFGDEGLRRLVPRTVELSSSTNFFVYSPGIVLNWDGLQYSPFATYGNFISLTGNVNC